MSQEQTFLHASSQVRLRQLLDGTTVHYYHHSLPQFNSFDEGCRANTWRSYYKPFALALKHPQAAEVMLIRDHLGVAPLYYYFEPKRRLIIGESIPEIIEQLVASPRLNEKQIKMLFSREKSYSDETFYEGIHRVEPGYMMHFKSNGSVEKKVYWQLEPEGDILRYSDDREYLDHFSSLMDEATLNATEKHQNIAAEFSAGLDSSAVYCALRKLGIDPTLYMHIATPGSKSEKIYNQRYEKAFIKHFQITHLHRVGAEDFDAIQVLRQFSSWFAGPAPYLFPMFSHNIQRAVAAGKHPILLSGFGGDQGISNSMPLNFFMPELIRQKFYRHAWNELTANQGNAHSTLRRLKNYANYLQYMHVTLYQLGMSWKQIKNIMTNLFVEHEHKKLSYHPYQRLYFSTERQGLWSYLQGPHSHEVRMRIEYSSVVTKHMGFEYRYPLLYPKLLEFFLSLPLTQKRRNGVGRYLMRQYLAYVLPEDVFQNYKKSEGLAIVPSTFELFQKQCNEDDFQSEFIELPYSHLMRVESHNFKARDFIKSFMIKQGTNIAF